MQVVRSLFHPSLVRITLLGSVAMLSSCAWLNTAPGEEVQKKEKTTAPKPQKKSPTLSLTGRVYSVNEAEKFIVVQNYGKVPSLDTAVMISRSKDGVRTSLKPTGEQMGQFFTADFKNSTPKVGDAVFYRPPLKSRTAQSLKPQ